MLYEPQFSINVPSIMGITKGFYGWSAALQDAERCLLPLL